MLRPHTFAQLGPHSFVFVHVNKTHTRLGRDAKNFYRYLQTLPTTKNLLGFYIEFKAKTTTQGLAYFPNLTQDGGNLSAMCPLRLLQEATQQRWVVPGFLTSVGRGQSLGRYIQDLTKSSRSVSPYALRIGGRTWHLSHGMDRQFVDYLGTSSSPEASARYYRESPSTVLKLLQQFYCSNPPLATSS